jgi:hypothetical protein
VKSTLQEVMSGTETRLHPSPALSGKLMKFVRGKGKDAVLVSADSEELKKLGDKLDRAVEELNVRILAPRSHQYVSI